jgi:serine/threonine protein kinase
MGCCQKKKKDILLDNNVEKNEMMVPSYTLENESDSHQNIKMTFSDYEPLKLLGRGSFGEVLLVRLKASKKLYAMKILNKNLLKIKGQQAHTMTERNLMVKINSPFIVNIKSAFQDDTKLYIVSEFMQGGDMFYHMHDGQIIIFNNEKTKFYIMELVLSLEALHNHKMVYRDLKPENILLDSKGHVKLTDFGLSKILDEGNDKAFTICGTPQYLAPEILLRKGYDKAVDWWSLGCVMYEMLSGKLPYAIKRGAKMSIKIYDQEVQYPNSMNKDAKDFIQKLLTINPSERLGSGPNGIEDIKNHPFFKGINWKDAEMQKIKPPFIPKLKSETDLRYFDTMFTEEPINSQQKKEGTRERSREPSNEYTGFTYVTNSVSNELMTLAKTSGDDND